MKEPTSRLSRDRWASRVGRSRATAVGIWLGMLLGALVATSSMVSAAMNPSSPAVDRPAVLQPMNATGTLASSQDMAATQAAPQCPTGQIPILKNASQPTSRSGAATPEIALRVARPSIGAFTSYPWFERADSAGPVWLVAGTETFLALRLPDAGWFVTPSTFAGCRVPFSR